MYLSVLVRQLYSSSRWSGAEKGQGEPCRSTTAYQAVRESNSQSKSPNCRLGTKRSTSRRLEKWKARPTSTKQVITSSSPVEHWLDRSSSDSHAPQLRCRDIRTSNSHVNRHMALNNLVKQVGHSFDLSSGLVAFGVLILLVLVSYTVRYRHAYGG